MSNYLSRLSDFVSDPFFPLSSEPRLLRPFLFLSFVWLALWNADDYK